VQLFIQLIVAPPAYLF